MFKKHRVPVDWLDDGQQALEVLTAEPYKYAIVLLDNQMPRMDGATATRKLRTAGYEGIIIGMTGDPAGCPERAEFEASGLDCCLDKGSSGVREIIRLLFESQQLDVADEAADGTSSCPTKSSTCTSPYSSSLRVRLLSVSSVDEQPSLSK